MQDLNIVKTLDKEPTIRPIFLVVKCPDSYGFMTDFLIQLKILVGNGETYLDSDEIMEYFQAFANDDFDIFFEATEDSLPISSIHECVMTVYEIRELLTPNYKTNKLAAIIRILTPLIREIIESLDDRFTLSLNGTPKSIDLIRAIKPKVEDLLTVDQLKTLNALTVGQTIEGILSENYELMLVIVKWIYRQILKSLNNDINATREFFTKITLENWREILRDLAVGPNGSIGGDAQGLKQDDLLIDLSNNSIKISELRKFRLKTTRVIAHSRLQKRIDVLGIVESFLNEKDLFLYLVTNGSEFVRFESMGLACPLFAADRSLFDLMANHVHSVVTTSPGIRSVEKRIKELKDIKES